jgi:hypothetical protein
MLIGLNNEKVSLSNQSFSEHKNRNSAISGGFEERAAADRGSN